MKFFKVLMTLGLLLNMIGCGNSSKVKSDESSTGFKSRFMNSESCDVIVDKEFLEICYDNALKVAKSVSYTLEGDLVHELNIRERPSFYEESSLEDENRANTRDYTHSGYDRGHLAPDASFDWSQESLDATYSLANIIPQIPDVNQGLWVKVEFYEREVAVQRGSVHVLNIVKYNVTPERIGTNGIAVSDGYYKVLYDEESDYKECFYYANENVQNVGADTLAQHAVDCSTVTY